MCYFVSIGARAPRRLLARAFEEWAGLDVAVSPVCTPVANAFPIDDEVCLVTWRGCSCDLVSPGKRATKLVAAFQRTVVEVAKQLGSLRMIVHRHREPCLLPEPGARFTLTVREFMSREHWFVEDVVMEISAHEPPSPLAFS